MSYPFVCGCKNGGESGRSTDVFAAGDIEGARALAAALEQNDSLTSLNLDVRLKQ